MKKFSLIIVIALFSMSCKNESAKVFFDAGVKKSDEQADSAKRTLNYKEAIDDFTKAIAVDPNYIEAYNYRAQLKDRLGDYNGFLQDCKKISEINPNDKDVYLLLANVKIHHKDDNGAITALTKAIAIDSKSSDAYYLRGEEERQIKNYQAAQADLNVAISISAPGNDALKDYYSSRALLKLELKDRSGACDDFHKSLQLGNTDAQTSIDYFCK